MVDGLVRPRGVLDPAFRPQRDARKSTHFHRRVRGSHEAMVCTRARSDPKEDHNKRAYRDSGAGRIGGPSLVRWETAFPNFRTSRIPGRNGLTFTRIPGR